MILTNDSLVASLKYLLGTKLYDDTIKSIYDSIVIKPRPGYEIDNFVFAEGIADLDKNGYLAEYNISLNTKSIVDILKNEIEAKKKTVDLAIDPDLGHRYIEYNEHNANTVYETLKKLPVENSMINSNINVYLQFILKELKYLIADTPAESMLINSIFTSLTDTNVNTTSKHYIQYAMATLIDSNMLFTDNAFLSDMPLFVGNEVQDLLSIDSKIINIYNFFINTSDYITDFPYTIDNYVVGSATDKDFILKSSLMTFALLVFIKHELDSLFALRIGIQVNKAQLL